MSSTTPVQPTIASTLNDAETNKLGPALRALKLGRMLSPVKVTFAAVDPGGTGAFDITKFKKGDSGVTINSGLADLKTGDALPPILSVIALRVSASGTATIVGAYGVTDTGGTAVTASTSSVMGVATLSDDGHTLTFSAKPTGLVISYIPRSATDLTTNAADGV